MHERSLVKSLIQQVREELRRRELGRLHAVELELGEFSGVEPRLVELAFAELAQEFWSDPVALKVTVTPLSATCAGCGVTFRIESFCFICPTCGGTNVDVVEGEQMRLISLEAEPMPVGEEAVQ